MAHAHRFGIARTVASATVEIDLPVAERWFEATPVGDGVTRIAEVPVVEYLTSNIWHVRGAERDLLVDTGTGIARLRPVVEELSEGRPIVAVTTHAHFDHMGSLYEFDERWCHEADAFEIERPTDPLRLVSERLSSAFREDMAFYGFEPPAVLVLALPDAAFDVEAFATRPTKPTRTLTDGAMVELGDRAFVTLNVPGHTPGSLALWDERTGTLFTGDAAYVDDPLGAEDEAELARSLRRLGDLDVRVVHAGHNRSFGRAELRALVDDLAG